MQFHVALSNQAFVLNCSHFILEIHVLGRDVCDSIYDYARLLMYTLYSFVTSVYLDVFDERSPEPPLLEISSTAVRPLLEIASVYCCC